MKDIRRPYRNLKSNTSQKGLYNKPVISHERGKIENNSISKKVEFFEKNNYTEDIEYKKDGTPIMRAGSHYDLKNKKSESEKDFSTASRKSFFDNNKRQFSQESIDSFKKKKKSKRKGKKFFFSILGAFVLIGFFIYTFIFNGATISVNPKWKDIEVSDTFLIYKEDMIIDSASSSLSKNILKSEPKEVKQKASGEVMIYNNYSTSPQVLIKNTRFQTKDGKVFRIDNSLTVPGKSGSSPGTIKAKVSADTIGSEYNIGPADFSIPGFKGTARYDSFYAKSSTSMSGGASGLVQTVSKDDIVSASKDLKSEINSLLTKDAENFSHEGYVSLYKNLIINYTDNQAELVKSDQNSYDLIGTVYLYSIKKDVLAKILAKSVLKDGFNELEGVRLEEINGLTFTLDPNTSLDDTVVKVLITGKAKLVWTFDQDNFKNSLKGQNFSYFSEVVKNYKTSINSASFSKKPFWITSFPKDINKIKIKEEIK